MIQIRCKGCGYLQTLSEERFLAINDDFLICPHCNEKVPKQWSYTSTETIPEEAQHKMMAFSRRILNGGEITQEVVYALEAQVRRYGHSPESVKALGIGYTYLGEKKKAEEFLVMAHQNDPSDLSVLHCLLEMCVEEEKFLDAVSYGETLLRSAGSQIQDEDVALLALAYNGAGRSDEAKELLQKYNNLDNRNPIVKRARKKLHKSKILDIRVLFGGHGPIQKIIAGAGRRGMNSLGLKAGNFFASFKTDSPTQLEEAQDKRVVYGKPLIEYWIYTRETKIPQWNEIRANFARLQARNPEKGRAFKLLELSLETKNLSLDYILNTDARELFDYPEDLVDQNTREFMPEDRQILHEARMIVRLRLSLDSNPRVNHVLFMVSFTEAVREITGGVVQDAISHRLWGTREWERYVEDPKNGFIDSHVWIEVLEEQDNGQVWIHSHGMQKFGLPDLELDQVSNQYVPMMRFVIIKAAEVLVNLRNNDAGLPTIISIPEVSFSLKLEFQPRDEEEHFPLGSLMIIPEKNVKPADSDFTNAAMAQEDIAVAEALPQLDDAQLAVQCGEKTSALREKLWQAHRKAREDLPKFKKSFQHRRQMSGQVYAVKIGFPAQGGKYEWMWVSLDAWRGKYLVGYLENAPILRKDLQKGSRVQLDEGEIFDWVIARSGNIVEGAYTENILS